MNLRECIWLLFFLGFTYELVLPYTVKPSPVKDTIKVDEEQEPIKRTEAFEKDNSIPIFEVNSAHQGSFRYPLVISYW